MVSKSQATLGSSILPVCATNKLTIMKRLVNYIKNLFGAYSNHRTRGCGWVVGDASLSGSACYIITPEQFRELFEKAYPDAAEFVGKIKAVDRKKRVYQLPYSIIVDGSVTAGKTRKEVLMDIYADALSEYTSGRLEICSRKDPAENKCVD